MGSTNKFAHEIINSGIFENISNFETLSERISSTQSFNNRGIEKTKGDIFEIFVEALLNTKRIFQAKNVYPQGEIPLNILKKLNLDNEDDGYDGVYLTNDDKLIIYQVKFRTKDEKLHWQGKNGLSSFIGVSGKANLRYLFSNTTKLPRSYDRQEKKISFLLNDFLELNKEDFLKISNFLKNKEIFTDRHIPDNFQKNIAIKNILNELKNKNRATCIMACGTGKTDVGFWVYEKLDPNIALVLVPSIALVKQIRADWLSQIPMKKPVMTFQLCSSKDITRQEDCVKVRSSDLSMEFYSDEKELRKWIKKKPNVKKIIFSTYQSSKILKKIFNSKNKIDFAIFDEAHRTAVLNKNLDSNFSFALDDKNIPIRKRLFMTATRRISDYKKKNKFGDPSLSISMDNEEIYGKVVVDLSFYEAANKYKTIAIPKIIISEVFSDEIEFAKRKISSTHVDGMKLKSDYLAQLIALKKTVEKHGLKKIFSFHSKLNRAELFTKNDQPESIKYYLRDFFTSFVSGKMSMRKRDIIMKEFKDSPKSIVSNARCLIEGVNVPSVDLVAFIDNKSSEIDIVQAIGRALRKPRTGQFKKKYGYIFVPLFIEKKKNEKLEDALERTNFKKIVLLFKALKEHDSEIAQLMRDILTSESRGKGFAERTIKELENLIEFNNPEIKKNVLISAVRSKIIKDLRLKWDEMVGSLMAYKDKFGHTNVSFNDEGYRNLRKWITTVRQRKRKKELFTFQVEELDKLGFSWDEPGATIYEKKDLKSAYDLAKKFKIPYGSLKKYLEEKKVKPAAMWFGSGIMKPLPLYKNFSENELCKLLNIDFLNKKNLKTKTQLTNQLGIDMRIIQKLIIKKKIKFIGKGIPNSSGSGKFYENFSKKQLKNVLGITTLDTSKLYTKTNLYKSIFSGKEFPQYGAATVLNLIEKKIIKPCDIGIGKTRYDSSELKNNGLCSRVYYFKPLSKKKITKLTKITIFNRDKLKSQTELLYKFHNAKNPAYFNLCLNEGLIKSLGKGPNTGGKGLSDFYEDMTLDYYKSLKKIDYFHTPKHLINMSQIGKIIGKSYHTVNSMISNNFIEPAAKGYGENGVQDLYLKKSKKEFLEIYKKYRHFIILNQKKLKKARNNS